MSHSRCLSLACLHSLSVFSLSFADASPLVCVHGTAISSLTFIDASRRLSSIVRVFQSFIRRWFSLFCFRGPAIFECVIRDASHWPTSIARAFPIFHLPCFSLLCFHCPAMFSTSHPRCFSLSCLRCIREISHWLDDIGRQMSNLSFVILHIGLMFFLGYASILNGKLTGHCNGH